MRKLIAIAALSLAALFTPKAHAQGCSVNVTQNTYTVDSYTGGPTNFTATTWLYTSGSASMNLEYCPNATRAQHSETLLLTFGTNSTTYNSPLHCVSCGFNDSASVSWTGTFTAHPQQTAEVNLQCSVAGLFYQWPKLSRYIEPAYTRVYLVTPNMSGATNCEGGVGGNSTCDFQTGARCTAATSPPSMIITAQRFDTYINPVPPTAGFDDVGLVWSVTGHAPWHGFFVAQPFVTYGTAIQTYPVPAVACTKLP